MANTSNHLAHSEDDGAKKSASNTNASVPQERASAPEDAEPRLGSRTDSSTASITGQNGTQDLSMESGVMPLNGADPPSPEKEEQGQVAGGQEDYEKVEARIATAARGCLNAQKHEERIAVLAVAKLYVAVHELLASPALLDAFSTKHPRASCLVPAIGGADLR